GLAWLVLEFVESGPQTPAYWERLGQGLARLHQVSAPAFGLDHPNFIGSLPQRNTWHEEWVSFFIHERIDPMLEAAVKRGALSIKEVRAMERLYQRLPDLFPPEPPALIHGDLWGGNLLCDVNSQPVLIDPAVYYGHREMELAFMRLFDRQPPAFLEAYEEIWPLAPGFRDRIDVYHLYPLLVHVNLFGGSYAGSVRRILRPFT
ncbi:MAG: ketosamine-3-kinase, partial [Bacteroidetes bacterium]